jgi:hypothetical protein
VTGSFGSLTALGDERRCRLIVANVLIQFKIENGEVFADTMRVGCPRQSGDVSLLNKPPKHRLRNASPVLRRTGPRRTRSVAKLLRPIHPRVRPFFFIERFALFWAGGGTLPGTPASRPRLVPPGFGEV